MCDACRRGGRVLSHHPPDTQRESNGPHEGDVSGRRLKDLERSERREAIVRMALRIVAITTLLLVAYYLFPARRLTWDMPLLNLVISLVVFAVFASFFGALGLVGSYWPVLLIVLGLLLLAQSLFRSR